MLGLVDYQSDEDNSDSKPKQQQQTTISAGVAAATSAGLAANAAAAPRVVLPASAAMLPDAASLFATSVDSRLPHRFPHTVSSHLLGWHLIAQFGCSVPWTATKQIKRVSTAALPQSAKAAKTATSVFPGSQRQQQKPAPAGLLLPPQLCGRLISCFSASIFGATLQATMSVVSAC